MKKNILLILINGLLVFNLAAQEDIKCTVKWKTFTSKCTHCGHTFSGSFPKEVVSVHQGTKENANKKVATEMMLQMMLINGQKKKYCNNTNYYKCDYQPIKESSFNKYMSFSMADERMKAKEEKEALETENAKRAEKIARKENMLNLAINAINSNNYALAKKQIWQMKTAKTDTIILKSELTPWGMKENKIGSTTELFTKAEINDISEKWNSSITTEMQSVAEQKNLQQLKQLVDIYENRDNYIGINENILTVFKNKITNLEKKAKINTIKNSPLTEFENHISGSWGITTTSKSENSIIEVVIELNLSNDRQFDIKVTFMFYKPKPTMLEIDGKPVMKKGEKYAVDAIANINGIWNVEKENVISMLSLKSIVIQSSKGISNDNLLGLYTDKAFIIINNNKFKKIDLKIGNHLYKGKRSK